MNLKTITYDSTDATATLDLINYNFDQLLANGYGPQGTTGTQGTAGAQGTTGAQGPQGDTGAQGTAGGSSTAVGVEWLNDTITISGTNIMVPKPTTGISTLTSVTIGDGSPSAADDASQLLVGRNVIDFDSNIRLTVPGSVNYLDFTQNINELKMSFNSGATDTVFKINAEQIKFSDSSDSDQFALFSSASTIFNKDVKIDADVQFNDTLKLGINTSATAGYVLTAADDTGLLHWLAPSTLGTNVPIGTVVPILSSLYNSTNFHTASTTVSATDHTTILGSGKVGTAYDGWYLCHGYTWFNLAADVAYDAPDLSGKTFTIDTTLTQETEDTILSGARIGVVVTSAGVIDTTLNTDAVTRRLALGTGLANQDHVPFNLVKVPHIIYLGITDDFSWRFVDVSAITQYSSYYINAPLGAGSSICAEFKGVSSVYGPKVNKTIYMIYNSGNTTFSLGANNANSRTYVDDGVLAPAGWYMQTGSTSSNEYDYWTGTAWSLLLAGTCDMSE